MADTPERKGSYAGVAATGAAILSALVLARQMKTSPGGSTFPPEVIELLTAIAADISDIDVYRLPEILEAIRTGGGGGFGYPPNADYAYTSSQPLTTNVAFNLPRIEIPDDFAIVIKAHPSNPVGSLVYVAKSAADAINPNTAWPLQPNESISYRIKFADELWCSASVAPGCIVVWTVEQRR